MGSGVNIYDGRSALYRGWGAGSNSTTYIPTSLQGGGGTLNHPCEILDSRHTGHGKGNM